MVVVFCLKIPLSTAGARIFGRIVFPSMLLSSLLGRVDLGVIGALGMNTRESGSILSDLVVPFLRPLVQLRLNDGFVLVWTPPSASMNGPGRLVCAFLWHARLTRNSPFLDDGLDPLGENLLATHDRGRHGSGFD